MIVYDEDGQFDLSDDGQGAKDIEDEVDVSLALEKLPERQRIIAGLILCGLSYKKIAEKLGITENNVQQTAHKIRGKFLASSMV